MADNETESANEVAAEELDVNIDPEKIKAFQAELEAQQNLPMGVVAGVVSALIGAAVWAGITVATEYQIGWMAVAVGFLVGYAVCILGKGLSKNFGYVGAVCALLGCVLGNLLSICGFISIQESVPFLQIVVNLLTQSAVIFEILKATFAPMDLLFYGIAIYEGYKFSFRQITDAELAALSGEQ